MCKCARYLGWDGSAGLRMRQSAEDLGLYAVRVIVCTVVFGWGLFGVVGSERLQGPPQLPDPVEDIACYMLALSTYVRNNLKLFRTLLCIFGSITSCIVLSLYLY